MRRNDVCMILDLVLRRIEVSQTVRVHKTQNRVGTYRKTFGNLLLVYCVINYI